MSHITSGDEFRAFIKQHGIPVKIWQDIVEVSTPTAYKIRKGQSWKDEVKPKNQAGVDRLYAMYASKEGTSEEVENDDSNVTDNVTKHNGELVDGIAEDHQVVAEQAIVVGSPYTKTTDLGHLNSEADHTEFVGETSININIVTKESGDLLGKRITLDKEKGELSKDSKDSTISFGSVRTYSTTLETYARDIGKLGSCQAQVLTNREFKELTRIAARGYEEDGAITRTREDMQYEVGKPFLLLLDADPSADYTAESSGQFIRDCSTFMPGLENAARVVTHSASSHIYTEDGKELAGTGGLHVYVVVKDPTPLMTREGLKQFKDRLLARAWNAGKGELFVDRAGRAHRRCIVDVAVVQPERLSFEGPPELGPGLVQRKPDPEYRDGEYLDLESIMEPLSWAETQEFNRRWAAAVDEHRETLGAARETYVSTEAGKLVEAGKAATLGEGRSIVEGRRNGIVLGSDVLYLNTWSAVLGDKPAAGLPYGVEAWQVMAQPEVFDKVYIADPVEPDYGSSGGHVCTTKARIHDDGKEGARIWSWAHGGCRYRFQHTPATLLKHLEWLESVDADRFRKEWASVVASVGLNKVDRDLVLAELKATTSLRVARIGNLREAVAALEETSTGSTADIGVPVLDLGTLERDPADIRKEFAEQCGEILECPDILGLLVKHTDPFLIGEEHIRKGVYLAAISPIAGQRNLINGLVRGESSSGKSYVALTVVKLLPPDAYVKIVDASEKALFQVDPYAWSGKFLMVLEANCLVAEDSLLVTTIRNLVADGYASRMVSVKDPETNRWVMEEQPLHGPTGLITTTTKLWLDPELETRLLEVTADESPEQTKRILDLQAIEDQVNEQDLDTVPWHAFYEWLKLGPKEVAVGSWATKLTASVDTRAVRVRRDFKRLLGATRIHALLHQQHRERRKDGAIMATVEDYAAVYEILEPTFAKHVGKQTPDSIIKLVAWVKANVGKDGIEGVVEVSNQELGKALGVSTMTAHRHVLKAIDGGYVENHQHRRKAKSILSLGKVEVDEGGALPTPDALKG